MKFCPTCENRYDEEILRFCTKDGTPLIDENQPNFTEMPSESIELREEDLGEETIVSYKPPKDILEPEPPQPDLDSSEAPRIVIPMTEQKREQTVRARNIPPYQALPPKQSTGKIVALTIFGTLVILALGLTLFWFLRDEDPSPNKNLNVNTNPPDMNMNSNLNFGAGNFNIPITTNTNVNTNVTANINANLKTPTPTPKPSPSAGANVNANLGNLNVIGTPTPTPTPKPSATITPTPNATPRISPTTPPTPDRAGRPPNNSGEEH